ncbi:hypothetical protein GGI20_001352 [Coemansia sp. BCRC 34301]|nr:hypothetical protein GGI20_001352 [Coemansia sp. BCRC 34301]
MHAFLASVAELNCSDQRAFLYSDLACQKLDNPDGYAEAVEFWTRLLTRACQRRLLSTTPPVSDKADLLSSALTLDRRVLASRLVFRGDTPMGLDCVVDEMLRTGHLCPVDDYFAPRLRRWAKWLALRVLPYNAVAGCPALLVATKLVDEAASRVLAAHRANASCPVTDNVMSLDEFRHAYSRALMAPEALSSSAAMSAIDARVLLRHLVDHRHAATSALLDSPSHHSQAAPATARTELVKFAADGSSLAITDADYATYQVVCTRRLLAAQVSALEMRIADLDSEAREALRRQQRPVAAARLRLKRHIETNLLTKRIAALETVERVVLQLQQTSSDLQLMQTLSAGTVALRALNNAAQAIDPDKVADAWEEEAMRAADLEQALADTQVVVDDMDVEAELEALIAMEEPKGQAVGPVEEPKTLAADPVEEPKPLAVDPVDPVDPVDELTDSMQKVNMEAIPAE